MYQIINTETVKEKSIADGGQSKYDNNTFCNPFKENTNQYSDFELRGYDTKQALHYSQNTTKQLLTDDVKKKIENVIKSKATTIGFADMNIEQKEHGLSGSGGGVGRGGKITIHVKLTRFYGDPKELSLQLQNTLKAQVSELANTFFNVWIHKEMRY